MQSTKTTQVMISHDLFIFMCVSARNRQGFSSASLVSVPARSAGLQCIPFALRQIIQFAFFLICQTQVFHKLSCCRLTRRSYNLPPVNAIGSDSAAPSNPYQIGPACGFSKVPPSQNIVPRIPIVQMAFFALSFAI